MLVGLISDTHGLLRPEAAAALRGVERIIHAGDVGRPEILDALRAIAPVTAVRGNADFEAWADVLPFEATLDLDGCRIYVLHDLKQLRADPASEGVRAVISGHTHKPLIETREGVLYVNPGAAGPRRFSLPISVGFLRVEDGAKIDAWTQTLMI